jgi:hypothetical protein
MNSVRFSAGPSRQRLAVLVGLSLAAIHGLLLYFPVANFPDISSSLDDQAVIPIVVAILPPVALVLGIAGSLLIAVEGYRIAGPGNNYLLLDQSGLSYVRRGKSRHWPWSVLPEFKAVLIYRQIKFVLPEGEIEPKRRDRWIHEVTPDGPIVAIQDIYDTPFDEIAAKLNEYRDHALAKPGAGGSQSTPAGSDQP